MKNKKYYIALNDREYAEIISSLINKRNSLIRLPLPHTLTPKYNLTYRRKIYNYLSIYIYLHNLKLSQTIRIIPT